MKGTGVEHMDSYGHEHTHKHVDMSGHARCYEDAAYDGENCDADVDAHCDHVPDDDDDDDDGDDGDDDDDDDDGGDDDDDDDDDDDPMNDGLSDPNVDGLSDPNVDGLSDPAPFHKWGYPNSWMAYNGKTSSNGGFGGTPFSGNLHIGGSSKWVALNHAFLEFSMINHSAIGVFPCMECITWVSDDVRKLQLANSLGPIAFEVIKIGLPASALFGDDLIHKISDGTKDAPKQFGVSDFPDLERCGSQSGSDPQIGAVKKNQLDLTPPNGDDHPFSWE